MRIGSRSCGKTKPKKEGRTKREQKQRRSSRINKSGTYISLTISCTAAASVSSVGAVFDAALEPVPSSM